MRGLIFGFCSVSLVYLSPSHNLSIIGVLQKAFMSNSTYSVLFSIKIILTFLGPNSPFASWCYHHAPHSAVFYEAPELSYLRVCTRGPFPFLPSTSLFGVSHSFSRTQRGVYPVPRLPLSGISQCILLASSLSWLHKLLSPVQNDSARLFVPERFRISRLTAKPSTGLS